MANEITFHPHAWGEETAREYNRQRNAKSVPDAYHQAIIMRNAADYAARKYLEAMPTPRPTVAAVPQGNHLPDPRNFLPAPKEGPATFGVMCQMHIEDPVSFRCMLCGKPKMEWELDEITF